MFLVGRQKRTSWQQKQLVTSCSGFLDCLPESIRVFLVDVILHGLLSPSVKTVILETDDPDKTE